MAVRGMQSDVIENWAPGVITSILKDRLPDGAVPSAKNTQFYDIGPGYAVMGTRKGALLLNQTATPNRAVSQYFLNTDVDDTHLFVEETSGDLRKLVSAVPQTISSGLFTNTANVFSWATANQLAFVVNGVDKYKTNGTTASKFGIDQPVSGAWSASNVGGGGTIPTGTYELKISYFNANTAHEGPASELKTVVVGAGERISVVLPTVATTGDTQITHAKIYIRPVATSSEFLLVVAGTSPSISGTSGWALGGSTVTVFIDASSTQLGAFRILAPGANENFPPPSNSYFLAVHKQRMFVATHTNIYWSDVGRPEAFNTVDNTLPVGIEDGEFISGIWVKDDALVVFTRQSVYVLDGDDPQTWAIRLVNSSFGCISYTSIGLIENILGWISLKGPVLWESVGGEIVDITTELIGPSFDEQHVNVESLATSVVLVNTVDNWIGWAITPINQSRNTIIIPFNIKLKRWMASEWNMVDVRSCAPVNDSSGRARPVVADYDGWFYQVGDTSSDGVPSGVSAVGAITGATSTTITDSTQAWTVNQLIGKYVYVYNTANGVRLAQRRRITANTATQLTLNVAWDATPTVGDTYNIGGILMDWRSAFRHGGGPFFHKRIEFMFFELGTTDVGVECEVAVYRDLDEQNHLTTRTLTLGEGSEWDVALWDVGIFADVAVTPFRIPVHKIAYTWQARVLHMSTGEQLFIRRTAAQWLTKTKKTRRGVV